MEKEEKYYSTLDLGLDVSKIRDQVEASPELTRFFAKMASLQKEATNYLESNLDKLYAYDDDLQKELEKAKNDIVADESLAIIESINSNLTNLEDIARITNYCSKIGKDKQ